MSQYKADLLLEKWQKDMQAATTNLVAFESSPSYSVAKANLSKMAGKTKEKILPPIEDVATIWEHFAQIQDVVKQAAELRKNLPLFGRQDRLHQIEQLLSGPSILLKVKEIPIEERGLTGTSQTVEKTTPQDLFAIVQKKFEAAAKAAALFDKTTTELSEKLAAAQTDLESQLDSEKQAKLEAVRILADTDPLTALDKLKSPVRKKPQPSVIETPKVVAPPAPPPQPEAPKEAPATSKLTPDQRVNKLVRSETLGTLDKLVMTTPPSPAPTPPVNPVNPNLESVVRTKTDKSVSKLENLLHGSGSPTPKAPAPAQTPEAPKQLDDLISSRKPKKETK